MEQNTFNIKPNNSILISRNAPIAFVVGGGGFIGSSLVDKLLAKNIQVIAVDDFSKGFRRNLDEATKNKGFHLIHSSINELAETLENLKLPRLDYAFFMAESDDQSLYSLGLNNFLQFIKKIRLQLAADKSSQEKDIALEKPKVAFISTIELYKRNLNDHQKDIKEAEIKYAKFAKYYKLNARIIRLAGVYGPRMHFNYEDPVIRLIYSRLIGDIQQENTSMDFSARSIFIDDAISLITKSVLSGSTSHKIYDGALLQPIKVAEVKQVLLDPIWHELKHFEPTELPPWPTPNLERTKKELDWKANTNLIEGIKKTLNYFERNEIPKSDLGERIDDLPDKVAQIINPEKLKRWSFSSTKDKGEQEEKRGEHELKERVKKNKAGDLRQNFKRRTLLAGALLLILYALILPLVFLVFGAINIKGHIDAAEQAVIAGDFNKANNEIKQASSTLNESKQLIESIAILERVGLFKDQLNKIDQFIVVVDDGINGVTHTIKGTQSLFETPKVISGEISSDPLPYYQNAEVELISATQEIAKVQATLDNQVFLNQYPNFIQDRSRDLKQRLTNYLNLIEKGRTAAVLMPAITAVDGKKSYLVLLQNNLELRTGGGVISSYAKLDFEKGKLINIKVDDIQALDNAASDQTTPPAELKEDLGADRLLLKDASYEIDYPTSARQLELLYRMRTGESVDGVIALNLSAAAKLLSAVGVVNLANYNDQVDGNNLYQKSLLYNDNAGDNKKSYLTTTFSELLNKVFYLSKQDWPQITQALNSSLEEKQLLVYLKDNKLFSYLASQNWAGVLPRGVENKEGTTQDFLAPVEANYGSNKANYYLERSYKLQTTITGEGVINQKLEIAYKNNSPSDVAPAGNYKMRFKIYLPLGAKLNRAVWGDTDITTSVLSFSDYNRGAYTALLELPTKQQKILLLEYAMSQGLNLKDNQTTYRLDVFKQPGKSNDSFSWILNTANNFEIINSDDKNTSKQKLEIDTDLSKDRSFLLGLKKN